MSVGLPRHIRDAPTWEDLRSRTGEFANRIENYLNSQVDLYLIDSRSKKKLPIMKKGDLALDFGKNPPLATLQQWDGRQLILIAIATTSLVGLIDLIAKGTGSGLDPTMFLKSDGANGWMLAVPAGGGGGGTFISITDPEFLARLNLALLM